MINDSSPTVLLAGGGYVLRRVAAHLAPASFVVTSRSAETASYFNGLGYFGAVLTFEGGASMEHLLQDYPTLSVVVDSIPPSESLSGEQTGSAVAARAALFRSHGIQHVVFLSTTGVFGAEDGALIDEASACSPRSDRAKRRYVTELAYQNSGVTTTVLRIPGIYGPGRGVGSSLKAGKYRLVGDGRRWTNRIHRDDLADTIVKIITDQVIHDRKAPGVLCVADDEPAEQKVVVDYYCKNLSLPAPQVISLEEAHRLGLHTLSSNQRVCNALLRSYLTCPLRYPSYREGAATEFS